MMFIRRFIQIILWLIPIISLFCFAWHYYGLSGTLVAQRVFPAPSPFITDFFPAARVSQTDAAFPVLVGEPVYFEVRRPRQFKTVTVELTYDNPDQTLLNLGVRLKNAPGEDINAWHYALKPIENKLVDNLNWPFIEGEGVRLYQRNGRISQMPAVADLGDNPPLSPPYIRGGAGGLADFFAKPPPYQKIAVFNYDPGSSLPWSVQGSEKITVSNIPATVFTNANRLAFRKFPNDERVQIVFIDGKPLELLDQHTLVLEPGRGIKEIFIPHYPIEISTDGLIYLQKKDFKKQVLTVLQEGIEVDKEGIDYVLTKDYESPSLAPSLSLRERVKGEGGYTQFVASATFDTASLWVKDRKIRFMISAPGLDASSPLGKAPDVAERRITVHKIKVTFD